MADFTVTDEVMPERKLPQMYEQIVTGSDPENPAMTFRVGMAINGAALYLFIKDGDTDQTHVLPMEGLVTAWVKSYQKEMADAPDEEGS